MTRPGQLGLAEFPELVPVALLPDITVVGPFVVPGYGRLVRQITRRFGEVRIDTARPDREADPRTDVLLFPYDFRQSVERSAEQLGAAVAARIGSERRRVIVVAHSMGGLVARYWLGPGSGAARCRALITLGTPHRGAPKALDVLANGVRVGPVRFGRLSAVVRGWPSVYELLPRYPALAAADGGPPRYPYQWEEDPAFARRAKAAFGLHRDIETAWTDLAGRPERPAVTAFFSRGHATVQHARLTPTGLTASKQAAPWLPNSDWQGDGTVPAVSAIPIESEDDPNARRAMTERHLPMAASSAVVDFLAEYEGESLQAVRGDLPEQPWLGLDLDEAAAAGRPVPFGVTLHGAAADERVRVLFRHRAADGSAGQPGPWLEAARSADGSGWHAELAPLTAGAHRLEVQAIGVPLVDRIGTGDTLAVTTTDRTEDET